jgi:hypothetical protein
MPGPTPPSYSQQEWQDNNPLYPLSALRMKHIEAGLSAEEAFTKAVEEYITSGEGLPASVVTSSTANEGKPQKRLSQIKGGVPAWIDDSGGMPLKAFGAKWDGATDDTTHLQEAIEAAASREKRSHAPLQHRSSPGGL